MRLLPYVLLAPVALQAQPSPFLSLRNQLRRELSGERALATTAFVEQYWRVAGNTGFNASIARVKAILDSAGFVPEDRAAAGARLTYRVEHRPMTSPTWEPVDGSLTIVGQSGPVLTYATNRHMLGMYSTSTPEGGVEGDLVSVGKATEAEFAKTDVAGKIVLGETSLRRLYTEAVVKRKALGVLAYNMPSYTRPETNRHSIQFTGIPYDSTNPGWGIPLSYDAREALTAALARGPVRVRAMLATKLYRSEELTLVAEARGSKAPKERFVFSAHVQEPGANDNASGVGDLAEMARVTARLVARKQANPARTITFLWGEEISSTARYLKDDTARTAGVRWGMALDMVGEDAAKTGGTFLIEKMPDPSAVWTRGEDHHTEWGGSPMTLSQMAPHYFNDFVRNRCLEQAQGTGWVVGTNPYEGGSDHIPFLQARKPGLLLWHFTDQFYHTDGDRIGNVSAAELKNVAVCALSSALVLASGTRATADAIVAEVERAAIERLGKEAALSVAAVTKESTRDKELQILRAWTDWYKAALDAVRDVEVGGPTPAVTARIDTAKKHVDAAFERARRQIFSE